MAQNWAANRRTSRHQRTRCTEHLDNRDDTEKEKDHPDDVIAFQLIFNVVVHALNS